MTPPGLTYVGGPTALLNVGGARLLTDPTFDPPGAEYRAGSYVLRKTQGPAIGPDALGRIDAILLSHDHHFDNLDRSGRALLQSVPKVLTTAAGAERLNHAAVGLKPGDQHILRAPDGRQLVVTATPARHGPPEGDRGPVVGFTLRWTDAPEDVLYISGDTV